ncbi:MAG TPA: tRNA guanosine(34) transglycosylase Tgt, partial [Spirochaetota bacterium]|nr:tRNA guanosine(34) transglycosylase Tgt [Spirochaetota bacterium]
MKYTLLHTDAGSGARAGELLTAHGLIRTPVFMPVATRAAIRALPLRDIEEIGFDIILS